MIEQDGDAVIVTGATLYEVQNLIFEQVEAGNAVGNFTLPVRAADGSWVARGRIVRANLGES